jgi:alkaline phosphatase
LQFFQHCWGNERMTKCRPNMIRLARCLLLAGLGSIASTGLSSTQAAQSANRAKNIILMIADGTGANTIAATGMYTGRLDRQIFDGPAWTKTYASTYPLRTGEVPLPDSAGMAQDPGVIYSPEQSWDATPVTTMTGRYPDRFAGYRWHKRTAPDSANTIVAAVTGRKTYNNAVNVDGNGKKLVTFAELAHRAGKSVGVVTTVQFADATPAVAAGAHNVSRDNRNAIASEMLNAGGLSVIMGTGNPDYDNDGMRRGTPDYSWMAASDWTSLKAGTHAAGFKLIETITDFEALAAGGAPPANVAGIARAFDSTQANRRGAAPATEIPYTIPRRTDVPSLKTMALGALNVLDSDADGMFLMIEGGAIDRAMHGNNIARMIEEKIEFDEAVEAVSAYLDANTAGNNWSNTLVIVTGDHDHLLFGAESDTIAFQPLSDNGVGRVPGYKWHHVSHSNQLVPLFARGPGAEMFARCADQRDSFTDSEGRTFGRGMYLDQTEIFAVLTGARCS